MTRTPPDKQLPAPQRRGRAAAIGAEVGMASAAAFARAGFADPGLVLHWAEIVGPEVARLAQPLRFSKGHLGGTLTLRAAPGAALFLAHEKRSLAERINAYLGQAAVSQIRFVQGTVTGSPVVKKADKKPGSLPPSDPVRRYAGPEPLKQALENLARRRILQP